MSSKHDYSILNRASIGYDYLHTNSTTHEFLFGAIAELVDNARDAAASKLSIETDVPENSLSFLDDGCGMDSQEVLSIINFGHSVKRMNPLMVGQYGNGLKSGAMRIGKDFMLLTKKEGLLTCLLLSRTFHEQNNIKEVIVPTPSFLDDREPYYENEQQLIKHELEMKIIFEYSPFKNIDQLFEQFSRITGQHGTLVICYNLRRIENGAFELDFTSTSNDIRMSEQVPYREEEHNSLRAYLAVLYSNPRMRVILRGEKVDTTRILSTLDKTRKYRYMATNMKACAEKELQSCEKKVVEMRDCLRQRKSEIASYKVQYEMSMTNSDVRVRYRILAKAVEDTAQMLKEAEERLKALQKTKGRPNPLTIYFGLNIHHRDRYGCLIYNNGRLIRIYDKVSHQKDRNDNLLKYLGVVAVVDVPSSVLEPTHNKQSFENKREYMNLLRAINEHMQQYWDDIGLQAYPGGIANFWKCFGYESPAWDSVASDKPVYLYKRYGNVGFSVQCDTCLKWRHLDFNVDLLNNGVPKNWTCQMHPNSMFSNCLKKEELPNIPEGRLRRLSDHPPVVINNRKKSNATNGKMPANGRNELRRRPRSPTPPPQPPLLAPSSAAQPVRRSLRPHKPLPRSPQESSGSDDEPPKKMPSRNAFLSKKAHASFDSPVQSARARLKAMNRNQILSRVTQPVRATKNQQENVIKDLDATVVSLDISSEIGVIEQKSEKIRPEGGMKVAANDEQNEISAVSINPVLPSGSSLPSSVEELSAVEDSLDETVGKTGGDLCLSTAVEMERMELCVKLKAMLRYFQPESYDFLKSIDEMSVSELLGLDLTAYFNAYHDGLVSLISEQVMEKLRERSTNIVRLLRWAYSEEADRINESNVFEKVDEFVKMI
ncbi:hypothetical protein AB6A40_001685 [Gnathostoma spinigerum]|uniref:CW-type domain-containing protein n=1 Tax=Gnathostoma spinigerum TaxID=75299 RepID=A0ABD6E607_9BILA